MSPPHPFNLRFHDPPSLRMSAIDAMERLIEDNKALRAQVLKLQQAQQQQMHLIQSHHIPMVAEQSSGSQAPLPGYGYRFVDSRSPYGIPAIALPRFKGERRRPPPYRKSMSPSSLSRASSPGLRAESPIVPKSSNNSGSAAEAARRKSGQQQAQNREANRFHIGIRNPMKNSNRHSELDQHQRQGRGGPQDIVTQRLYTGESRRSQRRQETIPKLLDQRWPRQRSRPLARPAVSSPAQQKNAVYNTPALISNEKRRAQLLTQEPLGSQLRQERNRMIPRTNRSPANEGVELAPEVQYAPQEFHPQHVAASAKEAHSSHDQDFQNRVMALAKARRMPTIQQRDAASVSQGVGDVPSSARLSASSRSKPQFSENPIVASVDSGSGNKRPMDMSNHEAIATSNPHELYKSKHVRRSHSSSMGDPRKEASTVSFDGESVVPTENTDAVSNANARVREAKRSLGRYDDLLSRLDALEATFTAPHSNVASAIDRRSEVDNTGSARANAQVTSVPLPRGPRSQPVPTSPDNSLQDHTHSRLEIKSQSSKPQSLRTVSPSETKPSNVRPESHNERHFDRINVVNSNEETSTTNPNVFRVSPNPSVTNPNILNIEQNPSITSPNVFDMGAHPSITSPNILGAEMNKSITSTNIFDVARNPSATSPNVFDGAANISTTNPNFLQSVLNQSATNPNVWNAGERAMQHSLKHGNHQGHEHKQCSSHDASASAPSSTSQRVGPAIVVDQREEGKSRHVLSVHGEVQTQHNTEHTQKITSEFSSSTPAGSICLSPAVVLETLPNITKHGSSMSPDNIGIAVDKAAEDGATSVQEQSHDLERPSGRSGTLISHENLPDTLTFRKDMSKSQSLHSPSKNSSIDGGSPEKYLDKEVEYQTAVTDSQRGIGAAQQANPEFEEKSNLASSNVMVSSANWCAPSVDREQENQVIVTCAAPVVHDDANISQSEENMQPEEEGQVSSAKESSDCEGHETITDGESEIKCNTIACSIESSSNLKCINAIGNLEKNTSTQKSVAEMGQSLRVDDVASQDVRDLNAQHDAGVFSCEDVIEPEVELICGNRVENDIFAANGLVRTLGHEQSNSLRTETYSSSDRHRKEMLFEDQKESESALSQFSRNSGAPKNQQPISPNDSMALSPFDVLKEESVSCDLPLQIAPIVASLDSTSRGEDAILDDIPRQKTLSERLCSSTHSVVFDDAKAEDKKSFTRENMSGHSSLGASNSSVAMTNTWKNQPESIFQQAGPPLMWHRAMEHSISKSQPQRSDSSSAVFEDIASEDSLWQAVKQDFQTQERIGSVQQQREELLTGHSGLRGEDSLFRAMKEDFASKSVASRNQILCDKAANRENKPHDVRNFDQGSFLSVQEQGAHAFLNTRDRVSAEQFPKPDPKPVQPNQDFPDNMTIESQTTIQQSDTGLVDGSDLLSRINRISALSSLDPAISAGNRTPKAYGRIGLQQRPNPEDKFVSAIHPSSHRNGLEQQAADAWNELNPGVGLFGPN